jgi:glycosyltransferase involved in cell wall biosynthesis
MSLSRIIFLIENVSFPKDRRVRQEAAALVRNGYEVSVICPMGAKQDVTGFEVIDGVKVYRYWQPWQGRGLIGYLLEYGWAMMCTFALVLWIWMRDGFDVLHAANPPDLFFLIAAPFLLFRKKFVFDQHDLCPELLEAKIGRTAALSKLVLFLEHCSLRLADLVIVTNQSAHGIAIERGARRERVYIVRNGPDLDCFVPVPPNPALKGEAKYLALYVGTLAEQDGVDRVVKAAQHIVHERGRKDVKIAILGDGDCLVELRRQAQSLGVAPYINFAGWVGDSQLISYISTADVCMAPDPPQRINQLSTFIKIMEYMCYGKVTVSFDLLESRRTAGPTGIYVEKDDPALFGDALLEALDSPELRERLGRVARERVRTSLHWGLSRAVLLEAYEKIIRNGLPTRAGNSVSKKDLASGQAGAPTRADGL